MTVLPGAVSWREANAAYLRAEVQRMRLLVRRRVLYTRAQWARHEAGEPSLYVGDAQVDRLLEEDGCRNEWRFYDEDAGAQRIGAELAEVERAIEECKADARRSGGMVRSERLTRLFSLSPFDSDVIAMCMAAERDAALERLYAYVQDDVSRRLPTPALAISLFGRERGRELDWMQAFFPQGALRSYGLLRSSESVGLGGLPLRLEERVAAFLEGTDWPEDRTSVLLRPVPPAPVTLRQLEIAEKLERWFDRSGAAGVWPRVNLYGRPECGHTAAARAVCERKGLALHELDYVKLASAGRDAERALERECVLSNWALYLDATALTEAADAQALRSVERMLDTLRAVVFLGSRVPFRMDRPLLAVEVPAPSGEERLELWQRAAARAEHRLNGTLESVAEHYSFGPATIARLVKEAADLAFVSRGADAGIEESDLRAVCRRQAGQAMGAMAQAIVPRQTWADLVVPEPVASLLRDIAAQARNRHRVYRTWKLDEKLSRGTGISALFTGPSGTGKTMAAEVIAGELGLDLYRIDLASVVSKYIGETEKNLRAVFDGAERSGAILFFDEADALFGKRTEVSDSHDRYANIEIDYLLQRMEEYSGLAILATNLKSNLDQAFLRRLRFLVEFPFPDAALRERIWRGAFTDAVPLEGIRWDVLARLEVPGGNIRNISLNAAFLAAAEGSAVRMEHLMKAARREYEKEEKLATAAEFGEYFADGAKWRQ